MIGPWARMADLVYSNLDTATGFVGFAARRCIRWNT
jgi:hypothetical protein